jgi:hypothetical protein
MLGWNLTTVCFAIPDRMRRVCERPAKENSPPGGDGAMFIKTVRRPLLFIAGVIVLTSSASNAISDEISFTNLSAELTYFTGNEYFELLNVSNQPISITDINITPQSTNGGAVKIYYSAGSASGAAPNGVLPVPIQVDPGGNAVFTANCSGAYLNWCTTAITPTTDISSQYNLGSGPFGAGIGLIGKTSNAVLVFDMRPWPTPVFDPPSIDVTFTTDQSTAMAAYPAVPGGPRCGMQA